MSGVAARKSANFAKAWLADPSTYPLMAVMGGAIGLVGFSTYSKLTTQNDVCVNKKNQAAFFRDTQKFMPWRSIAQGYKDPLGLYTTTPSPRTFGGQ
mmetsp:Transcript_19497/g.31928  ORF Transcript_19497/g.31928 Transcript_19497/m.31928 type:complete len:97 (+) Transcript_19497:135-425(+)|eukprot:CAMPEP_0184643322 /NCGR_PEP_ID=MMETSP0308-20130426/139_1 /TAXON_ID=38269 /ORGANISM="Gloeochaete witrockiana, Strain SAG 46.84" /LENGTH=96 /DNA_ID=CAMNT_0027071163 /DNA_START=98 /DNA_END=388 /DNA_ORIENTATION=-